jgi:hypothetical protein
MRTPLLSLSLLSLLTTTTQALYTNPYLNPPPPNPGSSAAISAPPYLHPHPEQLPHNTAPNMRQRLLCRLGNVVLQLMSEREDAGTV